MTTNICAVEGCVVSQFLLGMVDHHLFPPLELLDKSWTLLTSGVGFIVIPALYWGDNIIIHFIYVCCCHTSICVLESVSWVASVLSASRVICYALCGDRCCLLHLMNILHYVIQLNCLINWPPPI